MYKLEAFEPPGFVTALDACRLDVDAGDSSAEQGPDDVVRGWPGVGCGGCAAVGATTVWRLGVLCRELPRLRCDMGGLPVVALGPAPSPFEGCVRAAVDGGVCVGLSQSVGFGGSARLAAAAEGV